MTGRTARIGLLLLFLGYLAARLVVLIRGRVFVAFDTASYAPRGDAALDHGPVVSLLGDAPRLWGVPVFYALLGSDGARVTGQWLVATAAWMTLAWVVWSLLRHPVSRLVGAGGVLLFALLDAVGNWDLTLLSESLSISLGVLTLALTLRWLDTARPAALAGATGAAFWWTFVRPDIRVFTVIFVIILGLIAWRRPLRRRSGLIAAGALLVAVGWCTAILPGVTQVGAGWSGLGAEYSADEWLIYRLRVQVLPDPAIKAVFTEQLGMPSCPAAEAVAARPAWDIEEFADAYGSCPELRAWGESNRDTAFYRFAVAAPDEYARMTVDLVNMSWSGGRYAEVPKVLPAQVQQLAFPGRQWPLVVVLGGLALSALAAVLTRARRVHRLLVDSAVVLTGACLISTFAGVLAGTGEFWRFGIQEAIGLRLAMIMLLVASLDAVLPATGTREPDQVDGGGLRSLGTPWSMLTRVTKS